MKRAWYVVGREVPTLFWWENLKASGHLNDLGVDGKIQLQFILNKSVGRTWNGFIWLKVGNSW
jgi:hypothetical protein